MELASSAKLTVQGVASPQVPASKLVGVTDQLSIGVGEGDGLADCCVVGVAAVTPSKTTSVAFPPFE